jgi:hypothetical protein
MTKLSDISDVDKCKGVIIDSLKKDNFIAQANQPQEEDFAEKANQPLEEDFTEKVKNFFYKYKTDLFKGGVVLGSLLAGPAIIGGIVGTLGLGEAGIAAGSIAAWMMKKN